MPKEQYSAEEPFNENGKGLSVESITLFSRNLIAAITKGALQIPRDIFNGINESTLISSGETVVQKMKKRYLNGKSNGLNGNGQ